MLIKMEKVEENKISQSNPDFMMVGLYGLHGLSTSMWEGGKLGM